MSKPRAIDLFCGLGGWTEGLLAAGYDVTGYDIEAHDYDGERYPARLVLQDVLTLDGAQFADADLIVASPPCTEYSYMAMPWSRAKQIARALRGEGEFPEGYKGSRTIADLNALFNACFRIQREASAAAGRKIPMVVENVRGTEPWVGRARWNFGSYYLWGDVPALMPKTLDAVKVPGVGAGWKHPSDPLHTPGLAFNPGAQGAQVREALAVRAGRRTAPGNGVRFTSQDCGIEGRKNPGFSFDGSGRSFQSESVNRHVSEGRKGAGAGAEWFDQNLCSLPSKSSRRKAASARIAKIPFALSHWIARAYLPLTLEPRP